MIELGRGILQDGEEVGKREWLVTNGIGGFGMGTVWGWLTEPFAAAHYRVYGKTGESLAFL